MNEKTNINNATKAVTATTIINFTFIPYVKKNNNNKK